MVAEVLREFCAISVSFHCVRHISTWGNYKYKIIGKLHLYIHCIRHAINGRVAIWHPWMPNLSKCGIQGTCLATKINVWQQTPILASTGEFFGTIKSQYPQEEENIRYNILKN